MIVRVVASAENIRRSVYVPEVLYECIGWVALVFLHWRDMGHIQLACKSQQQYLDAFMSFWRKEAPYFKDLAYCSPTDVCMECGWLTSNSPVSRLQNAAEGCVKCYYVDICHACLKPTSSGMLCLLCCEDEAVPLNADEGEFLKFRGACYDLIDLFLREGHYSPSNSHLPRHPHPMLEYIWLSHHQ